MGLNCFADIEHNTNAVNNHCHHQTKFVYHVISHSLFLLLPDILCYRKAPQASRFKNAWTYIYPPKKLNIFNKSLPKTLEI